MCIRDRFTSTSATGTFIPIQITEEKTTRSIIVRGKEKDLDVVDKVIREIDVRTKQVLMEVFIVDASSRFEQELGKRLGAAFTKKRLRAGGMAGGNSSVVAADGVDAAISDATGVVEDQLFSLGTSAGTSGIGILRRTGSAVLKLELQAMEELRLNKIVSNPKVFTLDNQTATIKQGQAIPTSGGDGATTFTDAALILTVTPSIIGDGNVLLDIALNNDKPVQTLDGSVGIGGSGAIGTTDDGMAYSSGAMYKGGVAKKYTEPKKPKYTKGGFVSRRTKK